MRPYIRLIIIIIVILLTRQSFGEEEAMKTRVKHDDDKVLLEGVEGFSFEEYASSVHGAQTKILEALGDSISYEYLLGSSGLAFRMQVFKDALCPSSPHSCCGFQCVKGSNDASPWEFKVYQVKPEDAEKVAEMRNAVVESIDKGIPVQYGTIEDGIIVGYQKDGDEWLCYYPLYQNGKQLLVETDVPWGVAVYTARKDSMPSKNELAINSLKQAVEMAHKEDAGEYWLGVRAWDEYVKYLEKLNEDNDLIRDDDMLGNAWIYECLVAYRLNAANYLRGIAQGFYKEVQTPLLKAAELYEQMVGEKLLDDNGCFTDFTPYPWMLEKNQIWSNEMREEEISRLKAALPLEKEAIAQIEKALENVTTN